MENQLSYIALGGIGEVTKNLHVYAYNNEILLVDCGLGFADETMIGVDLLLPDISYLLSQVKSGKKIVGMIITHGHEDHMGALPFVLPQLPEFPIYGSPFTCALANEKLSEFGLSSKLQKVAFNQEIHIGSFSTTFMHVTHSVPDTAHIFIKTPVGNFYHGSDFKFDLTPFDGKKTDFASIIAHSKQGVRCLMSECLGSERIGYTPSEQTLSASFEEEMRNCRGKFVVTTYSSNISRLNQIMAVAEKLNKYVCFVGRSLIKAKDVARAQGILRLKKEREITADSLKRYQSKDVLLFVAGSQGQANSALTRIIHGDHRDVTLQKQDVVVFSADPIPGNEISVGVVIDALSHMGVRVVYSGISHEFHVSGHGSSQELMMLMSFVNPQYVLPISGGYRQMTAYKNLAEKQGYNEKNIIMLQGGQEVIFTKDKTFLGQKIPLRSIYVDEVSGEEIEQFVLHDRQKISQDGIVAIIAEIDTETGGLVGRPEVVARGLAPKETQDIGGIVADVLMKTLHPQKRITDRNYIRKQIREVAEKKIFQEIKRRPLVLPVVIEV